VPGITDQKLILFAQVYCRTGNISQAAREVGISSSYGQYLLTNEKHYDFQQYVRQIQKGLMKKTEYDAEAALAQAQEAYEFGRDTENANAMVKAVELKSKLKGLIIDRHHIQQTADLKILVHVNRNLPPSAQPAISAPVQEVIEAEFKEEPEVDIFS
jgi:phage terminase small subunit